MSGEEPDLSWLEQETLRSLRRLANARAAVANLAAQGAAERNPLEGADPGDLAQLDRLFAEREKVAAKSTSRFGGSGARQRLDEIDNEARLVLDRMGLQDWDELAAARRWKPAPSAVDPVMLDFAQRELAAAEREWEELQALELPPDDEPSDAASAAAS